jgi:hypothetical protein
MTTNTIQVTNEQLRPNFVITVTCAPSDIIKRLIKVHNKTANLGVLVTLIITIVFIIATSIAFVFVKKNATNNEPITVPLIFGIAASIPSIIFLGILCVVCNPLCKNGLGWMNDVLQIIQLNGKTWQNQVDSIRSTVPHKEIYTPCQRNIYNHLKKHSDGYIVLARDGIIIDELFAIQYDLYVVLRVELIDNTADTGFILRLFLATRLNTSNEGIDTGKKVTFDVYLFMASHMKAQELNEIHQSILFNSHRCLKASGFYNNTGINQQLHS